MILTIDKLFQIPEEKKANCQGKTFIGIDFGTSTTVVSIANYTGFDDQPILCEAIQIQQRMQDGAVMESQLVPSVISCKDKKLLVGQGAYALKGNPEYEFGVNLWHSFKMELGQDLGPKWFKSEQTLIKSPQDATSVFFRFLKARIIQYCKENGLSEDIYYAVSIPASFESNQRRDLLDALKSNGIDINGFNLIDEPNAAFISYINPDEYRKEEIKFGDTYTPKVLVFDFGAGTCDISILELGVDYKGIHVKNISISQFEELGGNNIDIYIAHEYLLPRIIEKNGIDIKDYTSKQLELIEHQLYGVAEMLKIQACKDFHYLLTDPNAYNQVLENNQSVSVKRSVKIYTDYGDLKQSEFSLTYADFVKAMKIFVKPKNLLSRLFLGGKKYNSITSNIESALKKAHVSKGDIDFVMMVGGSSKNPFVQSYIKDYFCSGTKVLIPQNMQTLVSQGAAIHSLLRNAFDINVVNPITSEPIVVVVDGDQEIALIPAGTEIPFDPVVFDQFSTGDRELDTVEIPICVSNKNKRLDILKIERGFFESAFPKHSRIELTIGMSADKVLSVKATCEGEECSISSQNPFANTYLTNEESAILKAQKESNIAANNNGGKPTRASLAALRKAYVDADQEHMAAETLEEEIKYYPNDNMYNYQGVLYHNSSNYHKAIQSFKKAIAANPNNAHAHSNLGHDYYLIGKYEEAETVLRKAIELKADNCIALITLGRVLEQKETEEAKSEAKGLYEQAFNIYNRLWKDTGLDDVDLGWFASAAEKVGKDDIARQVRNERKKKSSNRGYDTEKLMSVDKKPNVE